MEAEGFIWDPHAEIYGLNAAYANMTFGQNLSATMIQTAAAFSAVVNGGVWRTPTVVKGTLEKDGTINPDWRVTRSEGDPHGAVSDMGEESVAGPASSEAVEDQILS